MKWTKIIDPKKDWYGKSLPDNDRNVLIYIEDFESFVQAYFDGETNRWRISSAIERITIEDNDISCYDITMWAELPISKVNF